MPRLTPITKREQVSGDGVEAYDHIIESRGQINAPQSMHMYVPEIARCSNDLSDSLRYRSHLSDHDTELAIITAAREMDCDYVWSGHSQAALRAGVRQEAVDIVEASCRGPGARGRGLGGRGVGYYLCIVNW